MTTTKPQSTTEPTADSDDEAEAGARNLVWYHFMPKGWECPGHDEGYQSSSCIGAIYVG